MKTCNENKFVPVLTVQCIQNMSQPANIEPTVPPSKAPSSHLITAPLILHTTTPKPLQESTNEITSFKQLEAVKYLRVNLFAFMMY